MNSYDLNNQVAVITGGAGGIGRAIAEKMKHSGAKVAIWDISSDNAAATAEAIGATPYQVDVRDFDQVQSVTRQTIADLGGLDVFVNSAGIAGPTFSVKDYPLEDWTQIIDINLTGTFHCCKAILPHMVEQNYGRIVNIASVAGKEGNPDAGPYAASKAGVIGLTKSLGKEHARQDIAINCVTPAAAKTPILDQVDEEFIQFMLSKIPRGRFLEVSEAAEMVTWLCTRENSFTTSGVFDLSGGRATY